MVAFPASLCMVVFSPPKYLWSLSPASVSMVPFPRQCLYGRFSPSVSLWSLFPASVSMVDFFTASVTMVVFFPRVYLWSFFPASVSMVTFPATESTYGRFSRQSICWVIFLDYGVLRKECQPVRVPDGGCQTLSHTLLRSVADTQSVRQFASWHNLK